MSDKELLEKANNWFIIRYGHTPAECNVNFVKIWYKKVLFYKIPTVVFAPNEEIGEAFLSTQKFLHHLMNYFIVYAMLEVALLIGVLILTCNVVLMACVGFLPAIWLVYKYAELKKKEKIYHNKIDFYVEQ